MVSYSTLHHSKNNVTVINSEGNLPRESLLDEVQIAVMLSRSYHTSDIVTQRPATTNSDPHGPNLIFHFHINKRLDVWTTREHLDGGGWRVDLLRGTRAGDEEHDAKTLATLVHSENGCHPWSDPL
jgi:hypothetical protein